MEQQNVITTASHTARTATLNINPIQTYVTHSLPRWIKRMFFFSCFPSCLPKKNARSSENTFELWLYNRRRCCIETGSRQEKKTHKKKKRSNFGEHCYSSLLSAVFSPALAALLSTSKMASGLLSTAGLIPLCRQIISAAQNDTARRCEARPGRD